MRTRISCHEGSLMRHKTVFIPLQPIIPIPIPITLCAIGAILSRPLGHVHVWPLFAPLHSSAALNLAPKIQRSSRNARGKVSSQSFPLATTDLQLWKSHVPRIDRLYMSPHKLLKRQKFNSLRPKNSKKVKANPRWLSPLKYPRQSRLPLPPRPLTLLSSLTTPDG
ncbi:hypothetical protein K503DRAFT_768833 [Rhizopogon vinicolor AM-OR11-026]|uniref:Uncharacterized protein n=1 Tax=Rhizopogon vinicolor AM-OR11-026 TaxID=1314800 RepID=A0A1B7N5Q8_9AGAM|nr:hypothetical protein K503DRAFT_768833 [Rhizopogon vinicolor AM-OR11-026]